MSIKCNRCDGTGFLNIHQLPFDFHDCKDPIAAAEQYIEDQDDHDVQVCDCCGDGEDWYGEPGEHYGRDDPQGEYGPYAYNGGLCECH